MANHVTRLGSYTIPKIDVLFSGTLPERGNWRVPTLVLQPRFFKFSVQVDWN